MVSSVHVIRDATVIHTKSASVLAISVRTPVAVSTQPVEFTRINRNVIAHRIIHQAIQCMHVRITFLLVAYEINCENFIYIFFLIYKI